VPVLTPKPFRGNVIAAGAVVLTTLVWTLLVRFQGTWPAGTHLAYCVVAFAFVGTLAVRAPMEGAKPRAYQSALYLATVALWAATLIALVPVVEIHSFMSLLRAATLVLGALALMAFGFAIRRDSAACTLVGSLAAGVAVLLAYGWITTPAGIAGFRWVLLAETAIFAFAAVGHRDRRPRHGVALIDAAGLAVLGIALSFVTHAGIADTAQLAFERESIAWGWELLIVAAGFGLIAYSSVDRQPGPAYLGVLNLLLFTFITSSGLDRATFLGWPLALALAAVLLLAIGLRPTTPAPPPPDIDAPEAPPLPLR
jgi:hypothetical protein